MILRDYTVGLFVDGDNVLYSQDEIGWKIDYVKLLKWVKFQTNSNQVISFFYLRDDNQPTIEKIRFIKFLESLNFKVAHIKPKLKIDGNGHICNADPRIIFDMAKHVFLEKIHKVVLLSADGDFSDPLEGVVDYGLEVLVLSFFYNTHKEYIVNNPKIPFIDLNSIRENIEYTFKMI